MSLRLTSRDCEILDHLSTAVRLFSLDQIAHAWWRDSVDPRSLLTNESDSSPVPDGSNDILSLCVQCRKLWLPLRAGARDNAPRRFRKIAWQVQSRWKNGPRKCLVVVASSRTTKSRTGKPARKIKQYFQLTHDLGVAETFLRFRETRPEEATLWKGEGIISPLRRKKKVPDAIIAGDSIWPPRLVVEFAGVLCTRTN
jgi:hypothetical protein